MDYQVLARKWRPKQFTTMAGQEHVLRALQNALQQNRLHHAYLFTGTRGVGKTTVARIFAKALNCEKGVSSTPCGVCDICQDIDAGRLIDLIEVDAASRTKVEDTRELLDNVQYAPTRARFKIYLIDEVHMLSTHSFNALLKTLEEPPAHVKFLLATTDPQKLPVTVLSRCLQFHLKNLAIEPIQNYLEFVLQQEKMTVDTAAVLQIAKAANGSMRDALSLLDQALAFCQGELNERDVSLMLGTISQDAVANLLTHLAQLNGSALLDEIKKLAETGADFNQVLEELISTFHQIAICQNINATLQQYKEIEKFVTLFSKEDIQLYYQIALLGRRDLPLAPTPRIGMEMTLLRMLAFKPNNIALAENKTQTTVAPVSAKPAMAQPSLAPNAPAPTPVTQQPPTLVETKVDVTQWDELINQLNLTGPTKVLASHCTISTWENNQLQLILSTQFSVLLNERIQERLQQALENYLQKKIKLSITLGQASTLTPAEKDTKMAEENQQTLMSTLQNDANLQSLLTTFDVTLKPEMVKPVKE